MVSRASIGIPVIFVSSFLGLAAPGVRADEAYLCGSDTVVYVKIEELEHKKKTDTCIAAYYGLTVADDASGPSGIITEPSTIVPEKAKARPTIELKSLTEPDHNVRRRETFERSASLMPPSAAPGTDFRNVRVINAGTGESQWFKHDR
jgi:hypothetical protein